LSCINIYDLLIDDLEYGKGGLYGCDEDEDDDDDDGEDEDAVELDEPKFDVDVDEALTANFGPINLFTLAALKFVDMLRLTKKSTATGDECSSTLGVVVAGRRSEIFSKLFE
jgi:hypothetical protein